MTNKHRRELTESQLVHAKELVVDSVQQEKILVAVCEDYHQGVIGLIAGKLVEEYYRPAVVLSRGKSKSKASARSIPGFNIIEALRELDDLLLEAGGHPMAAGFAVENEKIDQLTERLQKLAREKITDEHLKKTLDIDCEIGFFDIDWELFGKLAKFEPHGMANSRPVFVSKNVEIVEARAVGKEGKHLKLVLRDDVKTVHLEGVHSATIQGEIGGIGFGFGEKAASLSSGDKIDLAFNIDENEWNGKRELQAKVKDIKFD